MELQITKDDVIKKNVRYMGAVEETVETLVNLPDYCPRINKVINTCVQANVNSVWVNSGKVSAEGTAVFRMLYSSDEGECEVYETSVPFAKKIDIPDACETDCVTVCASSEQTSCRVSGPGCAELKCSISLDVRDEYIAHVSVVSSCAPDCVKKLERSYMQKTLCTCAVNSFTVSDSFDIRSASDVKIYRTDVTPCINEYKCIKNKIMLKGIYLLKIVTLNDSGELCTQNESIQFSQIFDIDSLDENSVCRNKLKVCAVNVSVSSDRTLQRGRCEISVTSSVMTDVYNDVMIRCMEDAYSCDNELNIETGEIKCADLISEPSSLYKVTMKADISAYPEAKIADITVRRIKYSSSQIDSKWSVSGNIYFDIILKTPDSGYIFTQRAEDFSFEKECGCPSGDVMSETEVYINNMAFSLDSDSNIIIDAELNVTFAGVKFETRRAVTNMTLGEKTEAKSEECAVNVYFAKKGESVWSIAKSHKADPEQIKEFNSIDYDFLEDDKTLIFSI